MDFDDLGLWGAKIWAEPGFEPGTSRTQSENHTPRPFGHKVRKCFLKDYGRRKITGRDKNEVFEKIWAEPGFEPGTSRTQSENHTPRPFGHDMLQKVS
ncbi:unnamed protein product [Auanema sp. JU1783]|nr:unnamed protein product [Auanema sp. JU1783]